MVLLTHEAEQTGPQKTAIPPPNPKEVNIDLEQAESISEYYRGLFKVSTSDQNIQDVQFNLKVCFAYQPIKQDILRDSIEQLETIVLGFANEEAMNLLLEGAVDPSLTERAFSEQNRAEILLQDAKDCSTNNQKKIEEFREKYQVAVYSTEDSKPNSSKSKEIKDAIQMIRSEGLKSWLEFKETGSKPTPKPSNYLIPIVKQDVISIKIGVSFVSSKSFKRRLSSQGHFGTKE